MSETGLGLRRFYPILPGNLSEVNSTDPNFFESNEKYSINGYLYGNLPGLDMNESSHVRWYVAAMGGESDLHVPHWHGNTLMMGGMREDTVELLPMAMKVLDMYPDDPETWLFHCHVNDHIVGGMLALYTVQGANGTAAHKRTMDVSLQTNPRPRCRKPDRP